MGLTGAVVTFVVSLLVGGLGIYVGARLVAGAGGYERAVVTALVGALGYALAALLLGWLPVVGTVVPLLAWVWVVRWRYGVSWLRAAVVGLVAWVAATVVIAVLPLPAADVVGIPGV